MDAKDVIKHLMNTSREVMQQYLEDMSDADLLVRAVPEANHLAWQLGHVLGGECDMMTSLGHEMPPLPAGFTEAHGPDAAKSTTTAGFLKKQEYLDLMQQVRAATLKAVDATPDGELEKPGPESMRSYAPTVGAALTLVGAHELLHAGQFATVRRKLAKPIRI